MLIHPQFDPVAMSLGPLHVRWYGLMYLAAFLLFLFLGRYRARSQPGLGWTYKDLDDLLFYGMLGVVLGGRVGYVLFYKPEYYLSHPFEIFAVWQGGMAFHGGFLGVLVALWLFGRKAGCGQLLPLGSQHGVDKQAITTRGGNPAGRCMGTRNQPQFLQVRHDVANRCRRQLKAGCP